MFGSLLLVVLTLEFLVLILKVVQRLVTLLIKGQVAPSDTGGEQTPVALWAISGGKLFVIHFWKTEIILGAMY